MLYMNLVYGLARLESFKAQWVEHPTRARTDGQFSFSCRELGLFLCPLLVTCWSHHFSCQYSFATPLPGVAVGVKSSLKLPLNWLCQWYQEGKNAVLLGTKNDRKEPYATVTECNNTTFKNIRYASRKITHREPVEPRHRGAHQTQRDASGL